MVRTGIRLVITLAALFGFWIGLLSGGPLTVSIGAAFLHYFIGS